jgi:diguanylate cyclase (GGDEF)-like protein
MDQDTGYESGSFYRLLALMQRLLQTPDGQGLYRQIEKGSRACEDMTARLEHRFLAYLDAELARYLQGHEPEPATRMVVRLIRRRLAPYFSDIPKVLDKSTEPFAGLEQDMAEVLEQAADLKSWRNAATAIGKEMQAGNARFNTSPAVDGSLDLAARRQELISRYDDMQSAFDQNRISNKDFLNNLKTIRMSLAGTSEIRDMEEWKPLLLEAIDEMVEWQEGMMEQLRQSGEFLDNVRSSSVHLHEEIIKVRQLTQTDEFTGLPNQDAFMRRLYGEMQRARRFKQPLTVCLLGLDLNVMDGMDDAASEAVAVYADDVISLFRGYDIVARTRDLQFGVILPGTDIDGAIRALAEAQQRAARKQYDDHGKSQPLPSFHSGVASMHPNDDPDDLLTRAEKAYRQAAKTGPQTLEVFPGDEVQKHDQSGKTR